ncbi:hypothetical protein BN3564_44826 [Escherichia coli]|nr:hypothetical protein BN3564_44826 [Escherichia coli]
MMPSLYRLFIIDVDQYTKVLVAGLSILEHFYLGAVSEHPKRMISSGISDLQVIFVNFPIKILFDIRLWFEFFVITKPLYCGSGR